MSHEKTCKLGKGDRVRGLEANTPVSAKASEGSSPVVEEPGMAYNVWMETRETRVLLSLRGEYGEATQ